MDEKSFREVGVRDETQGTVYGKCLIDGVELASVAVDYRGNSNLVVMTFLLTAGGVPVATSQLTWPDICLISQSSARNVHELFAKLKSDLESFFATASGVFGQPTEKSRRLDTI